VPLSVLCERWGLMHLKRLWAVRRKLGLHWAMEQNTRLSDVVHELL